MTAVLVSKIVSLVQHDQIAPHLTAAPERIEQLIAIDFRGADDQRRIRILFAISGEYPYLVGAKLLAEFLILRICQRLQRARVPGAPSCLQQPANLFAGDPGFAAARRRRNQHIFEFERRQSFQLKRIRREWTWGWLTNARQQATHFTRFSESSLWL